MGKSIINEKPVVIDEMEMGSFLRFVQKSGEIDFINISLEVEGRTNMLAIYVCFKNLTDTHLKCSFKWDNSKDPRRPILYLLFRLVFMSKSPIFLMEAKTVESVQIHRDIPDGNSQMISGWCSDMMNNILIECKLTEDMISESEFADLVNKVLKEARDYRNAENVADEDFRILWLSFLDKLRAHGMIE